MKKSFFIKILMIFLIHINASAIEKVLLFGDSLMSGYGLSQDDHLSLVLEDKFLQDGFDVDFINASVSGDTSSGGLNRAEWSLSEDEIDLVILGLGANDMLRGIQPNVTEKNLGQIIQIAKDKDINVILAGMIAPTSHGFIYKKKFDSIFPKLSKKFEIPLIPFLLEGVALDPNLNQQDGIHPNKKGVIIISDTIKKSIIDNFY